MGRSTFRCAVREPRDPPRTRGEIRPAHSNAAGHGLQMCRGRVRSKSRAVHLPGDPAMPLFRAPELTDFVTRLFEAAGVPADEARTVATSLVGANLRGHDS